MTRPGHVAVLGAGIMGVATALFLARRGVHVTLLDAAAGPLQGASRWNEGKIHLGFLYSADTTLDTARGVLSGGLLFRPLVEQLTGGSIAQAMTADDDVYLCHPQSVVTPQAMQAYFARVADEVRSHPDAARYGVDLSRCTVERLSAQALERIAFPGGAVAGFRVPERSVATRWLADRLSEALHAQQGIELHPSTHVQAVRPLDTSAIDGAWQVGTRQEGRVTQWLGPFDAVINALWEGRLAVDATVPLAPPPRWSHRFRQSLFVRTRAPTDMPSAVLATGPFGDVKNYNGRDLYLSWYPAGLVVDSHAMVPPAAPAPDAAQRDHIARETLTRLGALLPAVAALQDNIEQLDVGGGWVYAAGQGALSDPGATIHRRHNLGVTRHGNYLSVDTGKYSTAPWLARQIADWLVPEH